MNEIILDNLHKLAEKKYDKTQAVTILKQVNEEMKKVEFHETSVIYRLLYKCEAGLSSKRQQYLACSMEQSSDKLFCVACMLYGKGRKSNLTSTGYVIKDYTSASRTLCDHERSATHNAACVYHMQPTDPEEYIADPVTSLMNDYLFEIVNDDDKNDDSLKFTREEVSNNRHIVEVIVYCALFLITHGNYNYLFA